MMAGQQQIHHQSSKIKKSQLPTASPHFKKQQLNSHSRGGFDVTDMRVISHRDEIKYNYSNLRRDNNVDDELTDGRETCNRYYIWGIGPNERLITPVLLSCYLECYPSRSLLIKLLLEILCVWFIFLHNKKVRKSFCLIFF